MGTVKISKSFFSFKLKSWLGLCICLLTTVAMPSTAIAESVQAKRELALARNYGLAACIIARYPGSALATEADEWAIGLVENGNLPGEAYPALATFVKTAPAPMRTKNGVVLHLQSCLDFANSQTFAKEARKWIERR